MTVNEKGLEAAREAIIGNPLSDDQLSRIIKAYLRAASKDAEPLGRAWRWASSDEWRLLAPGLSDAAVADFVRDQEKIAPIVVTEVFAHPSTGVEGGVPVGMDAIAWKALVNQLTKEVERMCGPGPALDAVRSRLTAIEPVAASPGVPDGWKAIPVEPTDAMLRAGRLVSTDGAAVIYRAMLAAAASPEPSPSTEDVMGAMSWALGEIDVLSNKLCGFAYPQGMGMLGRRSAAQEDAYENAVKVRALSSKQRSEKE